jgi:uncharacterized YccA/Bax inhibitor family protein
MEDIKEKPAELIGHVEDLVSTYYKLTLLNAAEKTATIVSSSIAMLIACTAGIMILLLGGFALSWWLGDLVENRAAGFLLGALFFLVIMIIILAIRKKVLFPFFRNLLIRKIYE